MRKPINVALVGYGMAGRVFHAPLIRATPTLRLAAIATSRADEVAALDPAIHVAPNPSALFADPAITLVVIATPSATHATLAADAIRAGKHVVVDKPLALSYGEAQDLVALARLHDRHIFVFHNRRYDSCFMAVRDSLAQGSIGRVTHFESHFDRFRPTLRDRWREDGSPGSGVWFDLGPHLVDQAIALFGRPQSVWADIAALREGGIADDWAHVVLAYPGMRAVLQASLNNPDGPMGGPARFAVHGTQGSLIKLALDAQEAQLVAGLRPGDAGWGIDPDPLVIHDGAGGHRSIAAPVGCQQRYYADVAATLTDGAPPPVTPGDMLAVAEVIEAAQTSASTGRRVDLP